MDNEKTLEKELEMLMKEIQQRVSGEVWQDIQTALQCEQEVVKVINETSSELAKDIDADIDEQFQEMLALAGPETEAEFWRKLHSYRYNLEAADEAINDLHQMAAKFRLWTRQYLLSCILDLGNQTESLKK